MQLIRINNGPPTRITKQNQLGQFRWTSTKIKPIEDLGWLLFDDDPWFQELQQQPFIPFSVAYLTYPGTLESGIHGVGEIFAQKNRRIGWNFCLNKRGELNFFKKFKTFRPSANSSFSNKRVST